MFGQVGSAEWIVALLTAGVVTLAVVLHYEIIAGLNRWVQHKGGYASLERPSRRTLLFVMFALLLAHVAEIWLFALGYFILDRTGDFGGLLGYESYTFLDFVYFSAATYSTVGYGDLAPTGPMRFLAGTEALTGFMLITWSASFTYLIMARTWGVDDEESL
jgi:hypothetical protein